MAGRTLEQIIAEKQKPRSREQILEDKRSGRTLDEIIAEKRKPRSREQIIANKQGRGVVDTAKQAAGGLLSSALSALSAPQQVLFKGVRGVSDIVRGDVKQGLKGLGIAAAETFTAGQVGGDIGLSEALTSKEKRDRGEVVKLPRGLETLGNVLLDPTNYVTFGTGTAAKQAAEQAGKILTKDALERVAAQGLKKGLTAEEHTLLREGLEEVARGVSKDPAKTASRQIAALERRAQGGINLGLPKLGTVNVVSGETVGKVSRTLGVPTVKAAVAETGVSRALARGFKPRAAIAQEFGQEVADAVGTAGHERTAEALQLAHNWESELRAAVKSVEKGVSVEDDRLLQQVLDKGGSLADAPTRLAPVARTLDRIRKEFTALQAEVGILGPKAAEGTDNYLRRLLSPDALKAVRSGGASARGLKTLAEAVTPTAAKLRTLLPEASAQDINRLVERFRAGELPESLAALEERLGPLPEKTGKRIARIAEALPEGAPLYQESAVGATAVRAHEAAQAVAARRFVNNLREIKVAGESLLQDSQSFYQRHPNGVADWVEVNLPGVGRFHSHRSVAQEINKVSDVLRNEDATVGAVRKALLAWERSWKTSATAFPVTGAFTARNFRSNLFLNLADGLKSPVPYLEAARLQRAVRAAVKDNPQKVASEGVEAVLRGALTPRQFETYKAALDHGVVGHGFFDIELRDAAKTARELGVRGAAGRPRPIRALSNKGRDINSAVENHARLSNFIHNREKLGNVKDAALRTKAVLFDYAELTPVEQKILKRVIPFYTFMRKNLELQGKTVLSDPARLVFPEKIAQALSEPLHGNEPEYLQESGARRVALPGPLQGLVTAPDRPFRSAIEDVQRLTSPGKFAYQLATKAPAEETSKTGREVVSIAGGPIAELGKALADVGTGRSSFTGGYIPPETEAQLRRVLTALVPALGRMPRIEELEQWMDPLIKARPELRPALAELLKTLTGLSLTQIKE